jgi:hypothetical protein
MLRARLADVDVDVAVTVSVTVTVFLVSILAASCGDGNSPASATPITSAPGIVGPTSGATVDSQQPTLTVSNVNVTGGTPVYDFQVATDAQFATIAAQVEGVAQGSGQTSWTVTTLLENRTYFWRARARAGSEAGPYSSSTEFKVNGPGFGSETPVNGLLVYDPLTNGMTIGVREGGEFTPEGWMVTSRSDYIRYNVPTLESGFVEWDNSNMEDEVLDKQWMLFGMWDPSKGEYRENPYRVNLQKLDSTHNSPYLRIRWISNGEQYDFGSDFEAWDLFHTYHFRIEWGPGIGSQIVRLFLDGQLQAEQTYVNIYSPSTHWIELGIKDRKESIIGVVYSNLKIGVK